jgi:multiple sugar transport system ATP-binding protein
MNANVADKSQDTGGNQNIRMVDVVKSFDREVAVNKFNLEIVDRELLVVLGPSGSGKSTVLNLLAGLEASTAGEIYFGGDRVTDVPAEERNISMVFQSNTLYPNKNVRENILFALKLAKVPKDVQERRLRETTRLLEIDRYLNRPIRQLSGGERQRVAIAKALVKRPRLFLLDEPFSSLDAELRRELRGELVRIHQELETTMLFVTHDQEEALSIADRIAVMNRGELIQVGPPLEIYNRPATAWVGSFVGPYRINFLEADLRVENGRRYLQTPIGILGMDQSLFGHLQQSLSSSRAILGIRPEVASLSPTQLSGSSLPTVIYSRQHLGKEILYHLKADGQDLRAVVPVSQHFDIGDRVYLEFSWTQALWFDGATERLVLASSDEEVESRKRSANETSVPGRVP